MIDDTRIDDLLRMLPAPPESWVRSAMDIPLIESVNPASDVVGVEPAEDSSFSEALHEDWIQPDESASSDYGCTSRDELEGGGDGLS